MPNGREITIRDHQYPLDDLYCLANGWYDLPRSPAVNNFTYLVQELPGEEFSASPIFKRLPSPAPAGFGVFVPSPRIDGAKLPQHDPQHAHQGRSPGFQALGHWCCCFFLNLLLLLLRCPHFR